MTTNGMTWICIRRKAIRESDMCAISAVFVVVMKSDWIFWESIISSVSAYIQHFIFTIENMFCQGESALATFSPGDAYSHQCAGLCLGQVMVCRLWGTKPFPGPMLTYYQLHHQAKPSVKSDYKKPKIFIQENAYAHVVYKSVDICLNLNVLGIKKDAVAQLWFLLPFLSRFKIQEWFITISTDICMAYISRLKPMWAYLS